MPRSPSAPLPSPSPLVGDRRALAAVLMAVSLATIDSSITNTALPNIAASLQAQPAVSIWVINAYQLAVVAALLPFAALADRLGARRIHLGGLAFFTLASLASALAWSLPSLVAARALQGLGAAAMMSVNIALVRQIYPAHQLGRGMGLNALVVGVSFAAGPTLASLLLAVATWPWLFALNLPLGLLAFVVARASLPRTRAAWPTFRCHRRAAHRHHLCHRHRQPGHGRATRLRHRRAVPGADRAGLRRAAAAQASGAAGADAAGGPAAAAAVRAVGGHVDGIVRGTRPGLRLAALLHRGRAAARRRADRVPDGALGHRRGRAAPLAGRLSDRYAPGLMGGIGLLLLSAGLVSLALLTPEASTTAIVLRMALCGLGFALFQSPNLNALMSSAPPERSGGASGMVAMARLNGQAIGAALVALCFGLAGARGPVWALILGAGLAAVAALASAARLAGGKAWLRPCRPMADSGGRRATIRRARGPLFIPSKPDA